MGRKIITLKYGESVFDENCIYKNGIQGKLHSISFIVYLIQEEKRNILIDVGCNDGAGFPMTLFEKPADVLRHYGVLPKEITDIVITHHHHDHIEAISDYPNARLYIQEDEYELGKRYIPDGMQVILFRDEYEIADGLKIKKIGGHSVGSSIVLCQHNGKQYVFCGDECYVRKCLTEHIPTGLSFAPEISQQFVCEYGNHEYECLLFHDPDILKGKTGYELV